ncbi:hypothetical protein [Parabacteroides sp. PF5-9]|uniref:hypothetical protein n=1 Tax=Parabacteroides sp. PF5-9 TaxID=1742404 RepID=UPI0024768015|nr:hypothetical protein [Parabacteroides sp. PF5-9]MDH6357985.1 hypothetical protein [Parabacteroides sp. PF5-9]
MHLGLLSETIILINTDFLNQQICFTLDIYKEVYPFKDFDKINLENLLYQFALNARIEEVGHVVDVIFAYKLNSSFLTHCIPEDVFCFIDSNQVKVETEIGSFRIRSFFADQNETCNEHYINILKDIYRNPRVSRIVMVADNYELNNEILMMNDSKSLFFLKKYHDTEIEIPVKYVNINYPIAYALGLAKSEI